MGFKPRLEIISFKTSQKAKSNEVMWMTVFLYNYKKDVAASNSSSTVHTRTTVTGGWIAFVSIRQMCEMCFNTTKSAFIS